MTISKLLKWQNAYERAKGYKIRIEFSKVGEEHFMEIYNAQNGDWVDSVGEDEETGTWKMENYFNEIVDEQEIKI